MHIYIYMMPYWGGLTHPNCAGCVWQTAKGAATDIPLCKQHAHGSLTPPDCKARGLTWMQQVHKAHVLRAPPPPAPPSDGSPHDVHIPVSRNPAGQTTAATMQTNARKFTGLQLWQGSMPARPVCSFAVQGRAEASSAACTPNWDWHGWPAEYLYQRRSRPVSCTSSPLRQR
jgi:hypothetical protein